MWYIVYRERFKSYGIEQCGYYVGYKNKLCDNYSQNWFEAKKYKSLPAAITKLGIDLDYIERKTMDDLLKENASESSKRDIKLGELLNEDYEISFHKGRIDKISDKGEFLGSAYDDVVGHISKLMDIKKAEFKKKMDKYNKIDPNILKPSPNIIQHVEGEDFWEGF